MSQFLTSESLIALLTLTALEIVLGIDNIVFIAIITGKLHRSLQGKARTLGLSLAMFLRVGLLLAISWVMRLTQPLLTVYSVTFSGRDLILTIGGLFLIGKATFEIHDKLEGTESPHAKTSAKGSFWGVIFQILLLDMVFSLDSVITAIGLAKQVEIMVAAIVVAVIVMILFSGMVSRFIERHPTFKMLALAFLILIGVMLVVEGFGQHINRGYIYFAMSFSLFVEILNMRIRGKVKPVQLHDIPKLENPDI